MTFRRSPTPGQGKKNIARMSGTCHAWGLQQGSEHSYTGLGENLHCTITQSSLAAPV
jgi:hypothetical protein